jgi:hypothetical protein
MDEHTDEGNAGETIAYEDYMDVDSGAEDDFEEAVATVAKSKLL